jgi:mannose-6-phosphate isomerase-like protein (cupin superfamily)
VKIKHYGNRPSEALADQVIRNLALPALPLKAELLEETARELEGTALLVPGPRLPFQPPWASPIFFGVATDANLHRESHHFHPHQLEIYCLIKGAFKMRTWLGRREEDILLRPGDVLLVPPGTCHHLYEWVEAGVAYVFRSPNDVTGDGVAKVQCDGLIHGDQKGLREAA